jgi:DNA-binding transcriptional MerR regulator
MAHEIAKLLLEQAQSFLDREETVRTALRLGMPLNEIQQYLDWLEQVRGFPQSPRCEILASSDGVIPKANPTITSQQDVTGEGEPEAEGSSSLRRRVH